MTIRHLAGGLVVAMAMAAPFIVPSVGGIDTWKILLGVIGLTLFVRAGMAKPRDRPDP